jgi:hypothetical protein
MNKEAQQIIEIADKLRSGEIEHKDARINLCKLFGLEYKTRYTGRAIVNNKKSIYHGIDIPELKMVMKWVFILMVQENSYYHWKVLNGREINIQ